MTTVETAFALIWMLIGVAFYSSVIGIISSYFSSKETMSSLLRKRLRTVEDYCIKLKIDPDLEEKLKDSIEYSANKLAYLWLSSSEDIFGDLDVQLKYDFLVAIHGNLITGCEFFRHKDMSFAVRIVPLLRPVFVKAGSYVWVAKDHSSCSSQ